MKILLDTHIFLWFIRLHRDRFDRMLICQALQNSLTIATVDAAIRAYSVSIFIVQNEKIVLMIELDNCHHEFFVLRCGLAP